jgi:hypothetical protein
VLDALDVDMHEGPGQCKYDSENEERYGAVAKIYPIGGLTIEESEIIPLVSICGESFDAYSNPCHDVFDWRHSGYAQGEAKLDDDIHAREEIVSVADAIVDHHISNDSDLYWVVYISEEGYPYHLNMITGESSWSCPLYRYLDPNAINLPEEERFYCECECPHGVSITNSESASALPIYDNNNGGDSTETCSLASKTVAWDSLQHDGSNSQSSSTDDNIIAHDCNSPPSTFIISNFANFVPTDKYMYDDVNVEGAYHEVQDTAGETKFDANHVIIDYQPSSEIMEKIDSNIDLMVYVLSDTDEDNNVNDFVEAFSDEVNVSPRESPIEAGETLYELSESDSDNDISTFINSTSDDCLEISSTSFHNSVYASIGLDNLLSRQLH